MNYEIRYFNSDENSFRAIENDGRKFLEGYASVYNVRSKLIFENGELFYEEIVPGAFRDVLQKEGLDVIFTFNHDRNKVLARTKSGTLKVSEDDKGLFFRADVDTEISDSKDLWLRVKRGDIFENSFAFAVSEKDYTWERGGEDGVPVRKISRITDLRDVSSVSFAAYPQTSVSARELEEIKKDPADINPQDILPERDNKDFEKLKLRIKIIELKNKF